MCPHGYYTLLRESKDPRYLRLRMIQHAKREGIKPTARLLDVQPRIVRKWLGRYGGTLVQALRDAHTGVLPLYVSWTLMGLMAVIAFLIQSR